MAYKNYVKDFNCRTFDTPIKIKQCVDFLAEKMLKGVVRSIKRVKNDIGGEDLYYLNIIDNCTYVITLDKDKNITIITRH